MEFVVYLYLTTIIVIILSNIVVYSSKISKIVFTKNELFDNANISMNFLIAQINSYDYIELHASKENVLNKLLLYKNTGIRKEHTSTFEYIKRDKILKFGGKGDKAGSKFVTQELALYIQNIEMILNKEKKLLFVKIITDTSLNEENIKLKKPVILQNVINLKYKDIISR